MTESLVSAGSAPAGPREPGLLAEVLQRALSRGAEYGDLFVEERLVLRLRMEDGRIDPIVWGQEEGAGIRLIHHGITQYVYTDDLGEEGLMGAVDALLRGNVPAGHGHHIPPSRDEAVPHPWIDAIEAMQCMRAAEEEARKTDPSIFQVVISFTPIRQKVQVLSIRRPHVTETRLSYTFRVQVFARKDGRVAEGMSGEGAARSAVDVTPDRARELGREAASMAVQKLDARPAQAGEHIVILAGGWGGVLLHEACGHGLEADFVRVLVPDAGHDLLVHEEALERRPAARASELDEARSSEFLAEGIET